MHMVKRWLTPLVWQNRISPRIFLRFNMHMVKRWLTTTPLYDRQGSHLDYFKDSACTWSKMIDPPVHYPNLQLFVNTGFHIGHHRGLSHERATSFPNMVLGTKEYIYWVSKIQSWQKYLEVSIKFIPLLWVFLSGIFLAQISFWESGWVVTTSLYWL